MDRTKAIELLNKALGCVQTDPRNCGECKKCENYATKEDGIEAIRTALAALEKVPTALDHIHNVVAEREYQRGYKQAKEEYDHKLTEIKSRFKDHYYNKGYSEGYEQGKADANRPEIPDSWIPVSEKMPDEKDTWFAKFWGTDRWDKYMFRGRSELVEVTVELEDGTRYTDASRTHDGKWDVEERHGAVKKKVVAWHYMSEPWKGE